MILNENYNFDQLTYFKDIEINNYLNESQIVKNEQNNKDMNKQIIEDKIENQENKASPISDYIKDKFIEAHYEKIISSDFEFKNLYSYFGNDSFNLNYENNENIFSIGLEKDINLSINEKSEEKNINFNIFHQINENSKSKQFQNNSIIRRKREKEKTKKREKLRGKRDYLIKNFLSDCINNFLFKKLKKLTIKCNLGKLYQTNYKKNIELTERELLPLIKKTVYEIFTSNSKNKEITVQFQNLYNKINLSKDEEELINLLNSSFKEQIELYYYSEEIKLFKNKKYKTGTPAEKDELFYKERNRHYYLLEPYGFIRYANSKPYCHNDRKKK